MQSKIRVIGRRQFFRKDIEPRSRNPAALQRLDEREVIEQHAA